MNLKLASCLLLFLCIFSSEIYSQKLAIKKEVSIGSYLSSSGKTPLLNKSNKYGVVPLNSNTVFGNAKFHVPYDSSRNFQGQFRKLGYSAGLEIQTNILSSQKLYLPEAYLTGRFLGVELLVGRKKEIFGLADTTGTFGSYLWAGNALPIPKIQISSPNYFSIIGKGLISGKFGFTHGWFGKQAYTDNYFLHQKWIYLKIGRPSQLINLIGGMNHIVQWGGYSETNRDNPQASTNGYYPADFHAYLSAIFPAKILAPIANLAKPNGTYPFYDTGNRFGNHLGSVDLGIVLNTEIGRFDLFRQAGYDADPILINTLSWDGSYYLTYHAKENSVFRKIGLQIINTQNQAYKTPKLAQWFGLSYGPPQAQSYFNHGQYYEGWSYNGKSIGTSSIIPNKELKKPESTDYFTSDNNTLSYSFSADGKWKESTFSLKLGHIKSFGQKIPQRPQPMTQLVSQIAYCTPLKKKNIRAKVELGWDTGELYGNQVGANITFTKSW